MESLGTSIEMSESELLKTLKKAVTTSRRTLYDEWILLVMWGVSFTLGYLMLYYRSTHLVVWWERNVMDTLNILAAVILIGFTLYYFYFRKTKYRTFTAISSQFVWIGVFITHNLNVIITKDFLQEVNFSLTHPLQMIVIGFALFVTGGIYRYKLLSISGVVMWLAAVICSRSELVDQFLIRAIANFICFVIPGILMYMQSKKTVQG